MDSQLPPLQNGTYVLHLHAMARAQPERFEALERVGFKVEPYGDISKVLYQTLGGHYMDVDCSAKIAAAPAHYTPDGLAFGDGSEIKADVIVFKTGFMANMREMVGAIVGREIEDQLEDYWGLNREGELLGAFKNTGHPRIWYVGGAIGHYYIGAHGWSLEAPT